MEDRELRGAVSFACCVAQGARGARLMRRAGAATRKIDVIPRALSSSVQNRSNCCTSSGSIVLRAHASSHRGFSGCSGCSSAPFLDFLPSLPFRREKRLGIVRDDSLSRK
jgi:hypothetical protein